MRVITESELRELYKQKEFTSFTVPAGVKLTPSALQFLSERRIKVIEESANKKAAAQMPKAQFHANSSGSPPGGSPATHENSGEKPEHMTHLRGSTLVLKNHPRIKFRGKLDSFEAFLIEAIVEAKNAGYGDLAQDLHQLLEYSRQIMSAEVREQPLHPLSYRGLSLQEIREHSHKPDKYYGVGHITPQPAHGKLMALLNLLRTQCRELELAAMDAFCGQPAEVERPDIIQALNRLSSLIYIMMIQLTAGRYKVGC
ncbi:cob(I)yrinic acid a,c-diamide adenosyltransferase [Thermincola potens]|uniref:Cob(I)yrinic acid a,c-diamide adenosyltransferase n=1 Tax=Thermincola potens (strain JR) TaxID=635013 RepID=D5X8F5_THEPJ|nr:cob(I)yrinic acid a,c-diamide adenosyltransferase [Thermincola potens]ADG80934.1 Cob(I)yrinic acid a,c-diamide adenosyltransferase [Thermincola potens JR]